MKRYFLLKFLLAHSVTVFVAGRPNILFVHMEDMGAQITLYGGDTVVTQNLDKLSSEGVMFE